MEQIKKRQSWVDYARGVAIILVLYRHVFEGIKSSGISVDHFMFLEHFNIMFFSFRMPLFFIVSGIFLSASFAKRGMRKYIENKAKIILYPYFLWGILQITLQIAFSNYTNSSRTAFDYLYLLYEPNAIDQFWYLYALFNVSVLYVILKYLVRLRYWQQLTLAIIMFYSASIFHQKDINVGFVLDIFHNYIFILIGDLIHRWIRDSQRIERFQSWKTFFILIVPFVFSQTFFLYENLKYPDMKYRYVEYYQPFLFFVIAVTGCAFVISVCFLLQRYHRPKWLKVLGRYSLYIYVSHVIVFAALRTLMTRAFHVYNVPILLFTGIIAGLLVPVLLFRLCQRLNMEWIFTLDSSSTPNFNKKEVPLTGARLLN